MNSSDCVRLRNGKIIPKKVLDLFPMGVLNVHPSLLPKYRGPTPFQTALLNGDGESGVSIILMDEEVDHGPILVNSKLEIVNSDTYTTLAEKLAKLGGEMLVGIIPKWIAGEIKAIPQDHSRATYTRKFTSEDGFIKPETILGNPVPTTWSLGDQVQEVEHAERQVRALNPEPGTWTTLPRSDRSVGVGPLRVKILSARIEPTPSANVLKNISLRLVPIRVIPAGKKEMSWEEFLRGNKIIN